MKSFNVNVGFGLKWSPARCPWHPLVATNLCGPYVFLDVPTSWTGWSLLRSCPELSSPCYLGPSNSIWSCTGIGRKIGETCESQARQCTLRMARWCLRLKPLKRRCGEPGLPSQPALMFWLPELPPQEVGRGQSNLEHKPIGYSWSGAANEVLSTVLLQWRCRDARKWNEEDWCMIIPSDPMFLEPLPRLEPGDEEEEEDEVEEADGVDGKAMIGYLRTCCWTFASNSGAVAVCCRTRCESSSSSKGRLARFCQGWGCTGLYSSFPDEHEQTTRAKEDTQ